MIMYEKYTLQDMKLYFEGVKFENRKKSKSQTMQSWAFINKHVTGHISTLGAAVIK